MSDFGFGFEGPPWSMKIRTFLSEFTDFFSAFSKYIAPTYRHDRCERSVQMRLYSLSKREFVCIFCIFFAALLVAVSVGLAGPPITSTVQRNASSLNPKPNNIASGPFILKSPQLSTYNQQLWVLCKIILKQDQDESFDKGMTVEVVVQGSDDELHDSDPMSGNISKNRTRTLHCSQQECKEMIISHLGFLNYPNYIFTVTFTGLEEKRSKDIADVQFFFKSYNQAFTQIEIWFRFVFLCITFVMICWFNYSLRKFYWRDWSIEQKWMIVLLPLLLLYNDPVFPLTFLIDSWIPGMFDSIFQASYLCALLLFWLCIYHGIRQTRRKFVPFYIPKLLIVGMLWISACTLSTWQRYNELRDPTYSSYLDISNFRGFKIFFFTIGGLYVLYLLYLLVRAYAELRSMPYFDIRLKFMTVLMVIVIAICITVTVLRFGVGVLEDNFVATLSTHYKSSAEFMSFYGLLNFYLFTMAVVYSPAKNAIFDSHYRDDPSFSMVNDSDEEVIYGSDDEDRQPLRNNHSGHGNKNAVGNSNSVRKGRSSSGLGRGGQNSHTKSVQPPTATLISDEDEDESYH